MNPVSTQFLSTPPGTAGYAMPAEWTPHQATWISWPHNADTWPDGLDAVEAAMTAAVQALATGETVHINVLDAAHAHHVQRLLGPVANTPAIQLHAFPTNDAWCRDHGAIFVRNPAGHLAAVACTYNAWGGKYPPWDLDDQIAEKMAMALQVPLYQADLVLEGGSIEVNGQGFLLTTEQCLLHPNRNPQLNRQEIETRLQHLFGVQHIGWLGQGIAGDDTDGHVDDLTRFVAEDTVLTVLPEDPQHPDHPALADNWERLQAMRLADGRALRVCTLPVPEPVRWRAETLPASYANFYIGNAVVLVPVFDQPSDQRALEILAPHFPTRRLVPIRASEVVVGLGTFHCLTQQVPAATRG